MSAADVGSTVVVTAHEYGTAPNAYVTTENGTNTSWGGTTLAGGAGGIPLGKCVKASAAVDTTVRVKLNQ